MDITRKILILLIFFACPAVQACFLSYRGAQAYAAGDAEKARTLLGAAVARNNQDWRSLVNLGTISFNEQNYHDALKHFDAALALNDQCQEARERRELARKLLEEQEKNKQEQEKEQERQQQQNEQQQQNSQQEKQERTENQQSQDQQKSKAQQSRDEKQQENNASEKNKPDGQGEQQKNEQQEAEDDRKPAEFNNEKQNGKEQSQERAQQEQRNGDKQQESEELKQSHHDKQQQNSQSKNTQQRGAAAMATDKDTDIPMTDQEKKFVTYVAEVDEQAQKYMLRQLHGKDRRDDQHNW